MRDLKFPDPVDRGPDLFDRGRDLATMRTVLRSRSRKQIVVIGGRVMGKTSLLNVTAEWAEQRASYIAIRLSPVESRDELAAELVQGVSDRVQADSKQMGLRQAAKRFRWSSVARLVTVLRELTNRKPGQRFLLCFDGFDLVLKNCNDLAERQIVDLVIHTIEQTTLPIRWLFTIAGIDDETRSSYSTAYLSTARMVPIAPWSFDESCKFINWLMRDQYSFDESAQRAIFAAAGGHPYFTKAVLRALTDEPRPLAVGAQVTPTLIAGAVESAVRSHEVHLTLSSMVRRRFSNDQIQLLDEASSNPNGLTSEQVSSQSKSGLGTVHSLVGAGYFATDGTRYYLRLGLWKQWRGRDLGHARHSMASARDATARWLSRLTGSRRVWWILGSLLVAFTMTFAVLLLAFGLPQNNAAEVDCKFATAGLRTSLSYPRYVSTGDQAQIGVTVTNSLRKSQPISASMVVVFKETAGSRIEMMSNRITVDSLHFGEKKRIDVAFKYSQIGGLLPDTGLRVPFELKTLDGRAACLGGSWSMRVAPVPHLRRVLTSIAALAAFVTAPFLAGYFQGLFTRPGGAQPRDPSKELSTGNDGQRRRTTP
jgi:hypothetical protein